jgi:hypothetical protein
MGACAVAPVIGGVAQAAAGDPIPGVDISLEQIPGGFASKCDAAETKVTGQKISCLVKTIVKAQQKSVAVDLTSLTKCQAKFSAACTKLQGTGGCSTSCNDIDVGANVCMRAVARPCVGACTADSANPGTACTAASDCSGGMCASRAGVDCP